MYIMCGYYLLCVTVWYISLVYASNCSQMSGLPPLYVFVYEYDICESGRNNIFVDRQNAIWNHYILVTCTSTINFHIYVRFQTTSYAVSAAFGEWLHI